MAFQVVFYTFTKHANSTARPSGTGHPYNCIGKEPLSVTKPRLQLRLADGAQDNPSAWNYAYISAFGRYYWVTEWTNEGPLWTASLSVDPLASWKTEIGAATIYVYRSSAESDGSVSDNRYPATANLNRYNSVLSKLWTVGGANAAGTEANSGTYVLGIISSGWAGLPGVQYYGFTAANLSKFMDYIFSDTYFNTILTEFGATEYPEAKVAINPLQYVVSARFFPIGYSTTGSGNYLLHAGGSTFVPIGQQVITDQNVWCAAFLDVPNTQQHFRITTQTYTLTPIASWKHPQSAVRGSWLNRPPFTRVELFFPPFGIIELDPAAVIDASSVIIIIDIDVWTGNGTLTVSVTNNNVTRVIARLSTSVGMDIPLSNIYENDRSKMATTAGLVNLLTSSVSVNPIGVLQAERDIAQAFIDSFIPHTCTFGAQGGSIAPMSGEPCLMFTHQLMSDDDNPGQGRPLCSIKRLSAIPGYISADSDELQIPCTTSELAEIRSAVKNGFYYE